MEPEGTAVEHPVYSLEARDRINLTPLFPDT